MFYRVQTWAVPGVAIGEPLQLANGITVKAVVAESPSGSAFTATLLESIADLADPGAAAQSEFVRIGKVLARLAFSLLTPLNVFSARVIAAETAEGQETEALLFPGPPPGIALFEGRVGFQTTTTVDPVFLAGDVSPDVEGAITWFLSGYYAMNPVAQVLCHWIGLEMLAPVVSGPWQCECGAEVLNCPVCRQPTAGPRTVRSIREFMIGQLGLAKEEFNQSYALRNRITHGSLAMDPDGLPAASEKAIRIQDLLLQAIKRTLAWPPERPPIVSPHGWKIVGAPGLHARFTAGKPGFTDQPSIYPG